MPDPPSALLSEAAKLDAEATPLLEAAETVGDSLEAMILARKLASALRAALDESDTAKRYLAEYTAQDDAESADRVQRYRAVRGDSDALLKAALGPLWSKLWGPELERLGAVVDDLLVRATGAESQRDTAQADVEAMRAVCDAARDADRAFADEDPPTLATTWSEARRRLLLLRHELRALDARGKGRTR